MRFKIIALIFFILMINSNLWGIKVKIKDLVNINGLSENSLIGYGIVTGLNGTGDSARFKITGNILERVLNNMDIDVMNSKNIGAKNSAFVIITAKLPPDIAEGEKIDVTVSSIGDAKSIVNGVLLQSPLKGLDGKVYAVAQGVVSIVDTANKNKTVGIIPEGAIMQRDFSSQFINNNRIILSLKNPDFTTLYNIKKGIMDKFNNVQLTTINNKLIEISLPEEYKNNIDKFMSDIGNIEIEPSTTAKIVINKTSGVIVINGDVKLMEASVSYKNLDIYIKNKRNLSTSSEKLNNQNIFVLPDSSDIKSLIDGLNKMGAKTEDIIAILYALKKAGALIGDIIVE